MVEQVSFMIFYHTETGFSDVEISRKRQVASRMDQLAGTVVRSTSPFVILCPF